MNTYTVINMATGIEVHKRGCRDLIRKRKDPLWNGSEWLILVPASDDIEHAVQLDLADSGFASDLCESNESYLKKYGGWDVKVFPCVKESDPGTERCLIEEEQRRVVATVRAAVGESLGRSVSHRYKL